MYEIHCIQEFFNLRKIFSDFDGESQSMFVNILQMTGTNSNMVTVV